LLSLNNQTALDRVSLFLGDRNLYFDNYQSELSDRGIHNAEQLTPEIILIDSLLEEELLVYLDASQEPDDALDQLTALSKGKLENCKGYKTLYEYYKNTEYGIGEFFAASITNENKDPSIFACLKDTELNLLAIDEHSDSYALIIIESNSLQSVVDAFNKAGVEFYQINGK